MQEEAHELVVHHHQVVHIVVVVVEAVVERCLAVLQLVGHGKADRVDPG